MYVDIVHCNTLGAISIVMYIPEMSLPLLKKTFEHSTLATFRASGTLTFTDSWLVLLLAENQPGT